MFEKDSLTNEQKEAVIAQALNTDFKIPDSLESFPERSPLRPPRSLRRPPPVT